MIDVAGLKTEERVALELKAAYRSYGFGEYRLSGFEDYSLYAENKSFQGGGGVLSFNMGGRLCALRPDVTLSIVKNVDISSPSEVKKLFYDETVYRNAYGGGEFSELRQIGVEVIGCVDSVAETEVCELILKTLAASSDNYVLDVSHAGIIQKALSGMNISSEKQRFAAECLERKSVHDFSACDISDGAYKTLFRELITLSAQPKTALETLERYSKSCGIERELAELTGILNACGESNVNVNFSIGGDADYYNGVVFKGYIEGVPYAVLSGGRYDRLLARFGKTASAIGFALYLGELGNYFSDPSDAPDAVVVYGDGSADSAMKKARELRGRGQKVMLCRDPGGFKGKIYYAEDDGDA